MRGFLSLRWGVVVRPVGCFFALLRSVGKILLSTGGFFFSLPLPCRRSWRCDYTGDVFLLRFQDEFQLRLTLLKTV